MVDDEDLAQSGYVRNDHLDDGRELITLQIMLPGEIDEFARESAIKEGMYIAFEALTEGLDDEISLN